MEHSVATFDVSHSGDPRTCGACSACCIYLPISAGAIGRDHKPAGIGCPRLCASGCGTYATRPKMCVEFCCTWLRDGNWAEAWRPDRSGLICLREEIETGLRAAAVYEIRAGALQEPEAARILEALEETTVVIAVVDSQECKLRQMSERLFHPAAAPTEEPLFLGPQTAQPRAASRRVVAA